MIMLSKEKTLNMGPSASAFKGDVTTGLPRCGCASHCFCLMKWQENRLRVGGSLCLHPALPTCHFTDSVSCPPTPMPTWMLLLGFLQGSFLPMRVPIPADACRPTFFGAPCCLCSCTPPQQPLPTFPDVCPNLLTGWTDSLSGVADSQCYFVAEVPNCSDYCSAIHDP